MLDCDLKEQDQISKPEIPPRKTVADGTSTLMLPLGINQSAQEVQTSFRRSLKDESGELKNIYVEQIAEIPINSGQTMLKVND